MALSGKGIVRGIDARYRDSWTFRHQFSAGRLVAPIRVVGGNKELYDAQEDEKTNAEEGRKQGGGP